MAASPSSPETYADRWISCTPTELEIRAYYFPWGSKHIAYSDIKAISRVDMGTFRGRGRIWGTANPGYWASLDPRRPSKSVGLVLDLGKSVKPFITPDDPDAVERIVRERAGLGPAAPAGPSPII
jgi:hypothetical protein